MLKRFFVTGTDTSVGKTVVSRALLQALAASGKRVAGYKPVAKGSKETPEGLRNKDALVLQSVSSLELPYHAVNPIALSEEESSVAHSGLINDPPCCPTAGEPEREGGSRTWWWKGRAAGAA
jgi:dethiobiotin synthetase